MLNSIFLFLGNMGGSEWILIIVVVLIFFGGKKIPELMRGMGRGVKEFKDGMSGKDETPTRENKPAEPKVTENN